MRVAALYVQRGGVYYGLPDVDPWDEARDARAYPGPWPVVAHPPCARWGRYWSGGPSHHGKYRLGEDGGCFVAALEAVRSWGGIIEHPEGSHAWRRFHIPCPPREGGWVHCLDGGWTCCVEQGHYGHRARKATWLYVYRMTPPPLIWGPAIRPRGKTARERKTGIAQRLSHRERAATPSAFRDLLLDMARMVWRAP